MTFEGFRRQVRAFFLSQTGTDSLVQSTHSMAEIAVPLDFSSDLVQATAVRHGRLFMLQHPGLHLYQVLYPSGVSTGLSDKSIGAQSIQTPQS
jgi:hypothetical protein